jgi:hypothetical protein
MEFRSVAGLLLKIFRSIAAKIEQKYKKESILKDNESLLQ